MVPQLARIPWQHLIPNPYPHGLFEPHVANLWGRYTARSRTCHRIPAHCL